MEGKNFLVYQLYAIYDTLLTQKQRDTIEDYFGLDLSLGEIAEMKGVSRQAVKCTLDLTEKQLFSYEDNLQIYKKIEQIRNLNENDCKQLKQRVLSMLEDR